jgi:hypothetical protein
LGPKMPRAMAFPGPDITKRATRSNGVGGYRNFQALRTGWKSSLHRKPTAPRAAVLAGNNTHPVRK